MSEIKFVRLSQIPLRDLLEHMSDPRVAEHMPLMPKGWSIPDVRDFVASKEARWAEDGLGHWAILHDGRYVGWGGFQKEGDDWDFGLVLRTDAFGLGGRIARKALAWAKADPRIDEVTFLLPPSRTNLSGLTRLGARYVGTIDYDGEVFRKYRLAVS